VIFLDKSEIIAIQERAIDEFGGLHGIRDEGALESAIIAVENRHHYENADLVACAATYAYHIAKAHAFLDGNKRTAAASTETFLIVNDAKLDVTNSRLANLFIGLASGRISRDGAEALLRSWVRVLEP
jgi:death-on-curing protein